MGAELWIAVGVVGAWLLMGGVGARLFYALMPRENRAGLLWGDVAFVIFLGPGTFVAGLILWAVKLIPVAVYDFYDFVVDLWNKPVEPFTS